MSISSRCAFYDVKYVYQCCLHKYIAVVFIQCTIFYPSFDFDASDKLHHFEIKH